MFIKGKYVGLAVSPSSVATCHNLFFEALSLLKNIHAFDAEGKARLCEETSEEVQVGIGCGRWSFWFSDMRHGFQLKQPLSIHQASQRQHQLAKVQKSSCYSGGSPCIASSPQSSTCSGGLGHRTVEDQQSWQHRLWTLILLLVSRRSVLALRSKLHLQVSRNISYLFSSENSSTAHPIGMLYS